jgi:hypothetical protein
LTLWVSELFFYADLHTAGILKWAVIPAAVFAFGISRQTRNLMLAIPNPDRQK